MFFIVDIRQAELHHTTKQILVRLIYV